jgi:hypothetical protein
MSVSFACRVRVGVLSRTPLPSVRETLLQVNERHTNEIRTRTAARIAQLMANGESRVPDHLLYDEDEDQDQERDKTGGPAL